LKKNDRIEPFERHSEQYEEWFERNEYAYGSELEAIKSLMPVVKNGIEIGVGSGRFAAPLGICTGIEPSKKMGRIAKERGIHVIEGVAEDLPFGDAQYDLVLMVTTICFLDDIELAFREVYRILKPKGQFIVGFVDRESTLGRYYEEHKEQNPFYRPATFYSVEETISYLKKAGFNDLCFAQTIFQKLSEIEDIEPVREGYGEGSFVVIKATK